jgi:hypothetical protein
VPVGVNALLGEVVVVVELLAAVVVAVVEGVVGDVTAMVWGDRNPNDGFFTSTLC